MKKIIAAFDFDGTLVNKDSLLPFLLYINGWKKTIIKLILSSPVLIGFVLGLKTRQEAKESLLTQFFKGMPIENLNQLAKGYAAESLNTFLREGALERVEWHKSQGHRCVIISASIETYLKPWAEAVGFSDVIASKLETTDEGVITGKLQGKNCWGEEKIRRLEQVVGPKKEYVLYAYGDSRGDRELLELADYPFYRKLNP